MGQFETRAALFGHSLEALQKGDTITTTRKVNSLEELRSLMHDGAPDDVRAARVADYTSNHPAMMDEANADINAVHLRAAAYIHADRPLCADDAQMVAPTFPVNVTLISTADQTIDSEWNLGNEASPVSVNIGTLTINQGGYITATATAVTFVAQAVVNNSSGGTGANFTIGIFGSPGTAGLPGTSPGAAANGSNGSNSDVPTPGICTGARSPTAGQVGSPGTQGGQGQPGGNGTPNQTASFTFNAISGTPLLLQTQSGAGGAGGAGGNGGSGGNGGTGGDGCQSGCEGTHSADGGNGGAGASGGAGGPGGNGVNGNPIHVVLAMGVSPAMFGNVGLVAPPGNGGAGGNAGSGGAGGAGGSGSGKHRSAGNAGTPGTPGTPGTAGAPGSYSGNPGTVTVTTG
jgi:hypothetical protein